MIRSCYYLIFENCIVISYFSKQQRLVWLEQDKFGQLMAILPEIKSMSMRGEEFLFFKHVNGNAPTQTLLMEMLHAKRKA